MDWGILVLVLVFTARGWVRGNLAQLFSLVGLLAGIAVAGFVLQWVGAHWHHARPAAAFWLLRVVLALFCGLAVASFLSWLGSRARDSVRKGPVGWLDGPGGAALGLSKGVIAALLIVWVGVMIPWPRALSHAAARARLATPILSGAAETCEFGVGYVPGSAWLRDRFRAAERRVIELNRPS
jgi:uncharacterized membrane protein required for colicin V production